MPRICHPLLPLIGSPRQQDLLAQFKCVLAQLEFLQTENRILRSKLPQRVTVTKEEKAKLLKLGQRLGPALQCLLTIVSIRTFQRWAAAGRKPTSKPVEAKRKSGRPPTDEEVRQTVLQLARENQWGYTRILGELKKLDMGTISRSTVVNILKDAGLDPGPKRGQGTWHEHLRIHARTLWACDFASKKVWTGRGLIDYFILFAINIDTRQVHLVGITDHPTGPWMAQQARNLCMHWQDQPLPATHFIHDRDTKFTAQFDAILESQGVHVHKLSPAAPNMNAFAERWVLSLKSECLNHFIVLGENHLRYLVSSYLDYYHRLRPHQAKGNAPLSSRPPPANATGRIACDEMLGGLLRHYYRKAA